jgi:hypothetical protein
MVGKVGYSAGGEYVGGRCSLVSHCGRIGGGGEYEEREDEKGQKD